MEDVFFMTGEIIKENVIRCAIYIRVSTAEQQIHGKSLNAQKEYLCDYATHNQMKIIGIYADEGQSARKELKKRRAIHQLLNDVKEYKIDRILFWKMDRWFRNISDFYKVQETLDQYHVSWQAVAEPNMNLNTRDGRLNLNIMLSIGQNEVDTTSERIRFTVNSMIKNGRLVWGEKNLPFGYKIDTIQGEKIIIKNPEEEHIVQEVFDYFLLHQRKKETILYIQRTFGIHFSYMMFRTMISSEFYIGKYRENHNYCPAYLSLEQWQRIQDISKKNIKQERSDRIYLFSGLLHCPLCHIRLTGTGCSAMINRATGEKRAYCYYRCNNMHLNHLCSFSYRLSQDLLEDYILTNLSPLFENFTIHSFQINDKKIQKKKRSPSKIQQEVTRLNLLFQKGRIDWNYYNTQYELLEKEKNELPSLALHEHSHAHIEHLLNGNFHQLYQSLTAQNRQAFWRCILKDIVINVQNEIEKITFQ
jgi:DNA invertase Pin-like site-specific DNA recombinase